MSIHLYCALVARVEAAAAVSRLRARGSAEWICLEEACRRECLCRCRASDLVLLFTQTGSNTTYRTYRTYKGDDDETTITTSQCDTHCLADCLRDRLQVQRKLYLLDGEQSRARKEHEQLDYHYQRTGHASGHRGQIQRGRQQPGRRNLQRHSGNYSPW